MIKTALYRTVWRWHFYAGLFVVPLVLILSVTGSIYLFKPQLDRWQERHWRDLPSDSPVLPEDQLALALAAVPGASLNFYRIPEAAGEAALINVALPEPGQIREVYVSPQGKVLAIMKPGWRISETVRSLHGSLLAGKAGGLVVELAASWAIALIVTGLYLWWPRGPGMGGVVWPRLSAKGRVFWRDLHAVTGFWVSGLALVLLLTGLPWTETWGTGFSLIRTEMGWVKGPSNWKVGSNAAHHTHDRHVTPKEQVSESAAGAVGLNRIVELAGMETTVAPAIVQPPGSQRPFGPPNGQYWTLTSLTQNLPKAATVRYDMVSGQVIERSGFSDKHPMDRLINYGIAWHEGQLFGTLNQLVGVCTALCLILVAGSSTVMWWKRRPAHALGAPPYPGNVQIRTITIIILLFAAFLPLLALSLVVIMVADRLILPLFPKISAWLGRPARL